jgi:Histone H1-like protein Hc1
MAKKDKKKKDSPQDRGREIVDEVARAVGRIREELSQRNVSDDLKSLRSEVETLARRVAALEVPGRGSSSARTTAAKKPAAKKPAASRSRAAKKPAASRSTAAKKPAASRSRSTTTRSRSTSTRSRSSGSS